MEGFGCLYFIPIVVATSVHIHLFAKGGELNMKKIIAALMSLTAVAFVAAPVFAAEVEVTNENHMTGADSTNDNKTDIENDVTAVVDNNGNVNNSAAASVETGHNKQDKNTEAGDIESGSVDASTDWESVVNDSASLFSGASDDGVMVAFDGLNDVTGADSKNTNELEFDNDSVMTLVNTAFVLNALGLDADTGYNTQTKNTEGGSLMSGNIGVDFAATNEANNDSGFSSAATHSTEVSFTGENHKTGADSKNENKVDVESTTTATVVNVASLTNSVGVTANTGHNKQSKNTQAGDLKSGDVNVSVDVSNEANNGSSFASAGSHDLTVDVDTTNDTTGADSKNTNKVEVDNTTTEVVTNNATVTNGVSVTADTGNNEESKNTEGGSIETGDVSIDFSASTTVNSN